MDPSAEPLAKEIRDAVARCLNGTDRAAVMFSGGVDSSILAVLARKQCPVMLYALGTEGSHDAVWALQCASIIDLPLTGISYGREDILRSMHDVILTQGMTKARWMSTFVAFDMVLRNVTEKTVICGQGADEAFGGYRKYIGAPDPVAQMDSDLEALITEEMPAYRKMAEHYGKSLITPFLEPGVLKVAKGSNHRASPGTAGNKPLLRNAARIIGVPGMMAERPKKAMQYGSGVSSAIKRLLKDSGTDLDSFIDRLAEMRK